MSDATLYVVRDPAGNIFGPATVQTLRNWQREGRIIATMQITPQGTNAWQNVTSHPGMADLFGGILAPSPPPLGTPAGATGSAGPPPVPPPPLPDEAPIDKATRYVRGYFRDLAKISPMALWGNITSAAGLILCCGCGGILGIAGAVMGVLALDRSELGEGKEQLDPKVRTGAVVAIVLGLAALATNCAGFTVMYYVTGYLKK